MYLLAKEYKNHPADTLILKALATDSDVTFGEVKALEHIHEYVDSGIMLIPEISKDIKVRVIVMLRKVGHEVLVKSEGYKNANADDKKKMKEDGLKMMCKKVASFVVNEEIFHS
ncbi:hypothetical protein BT96DRAFT_721009 [Gymnopus androsaceus JB14]|uniref:Uncharacterized protein n=1 Tax=Gymnopus androsaceus JB14 TaxID=1447944 RepID=A0A6A4HMZ4_9AGAR|nr:hypothetical protein BT96DRAFT_721009 [Gymnopus androsaceus JB14]